MIKSNVFRVSAILVCSVITGFAMSGTVWSEVKDNVACVYHSDANWNCCPDTVFVITPHPDTTGIIDIYERDLGTNPCGCMCYFDFSHTLEGLLPGTYTARVWECLGESDEYNTLAGSTAFKIPAKIGSFYTTTDMSQCHDAVWEKPQNEREDIELEASSILPDISSVNIHYYLPGASEVLITIYDVTGTKIWTLDVGNSVQGERHVTWDTRTDSGQRVSQGGCTS